MPAIDRTLVSAVAGRARRNAVSPRFWLIFLGLLILALLLVVATPAAGIFSFFGGGTAGQEPEETPAVPSDAG